MQFSCGLIPARAGTTASCTHALLRPGAHPRSRGDHTVGRIRVFTVGGSSPLARGPRAVHVVHTSHRGLIPARAGTTGMPSAIASRLRAHPRSRGDHRFSSHGPITWMGSSPLARGPPSTSDRTSTSTGLIPARAGTTMRLPTTSRSPWAHPRSRGDHNHMTANIIKGLGSSPLARGPLHVLRGS